MRGEGEGVADPCRDPDGGLRYCSRYRPDEDDDDDQTAALSLSSHEVSVRQFCRRIECVQGTSTCQVLRSEMQPARQPVIIWLSNLSDRK